MDRYSDVLEYTQMVGFCGELCANENEEMAQKMSNEIMGNERPTVDIRKRRKRYFAKNRFAGFGFHLKLP